jgi:hypothetical protein
LNGEKKRLSVYQLFSHEKPKKKYYYSKEIGNSPQKKQNRNPLHSTFFLVFSIESEGIIPKTAELRHLAGFCAAVNGSSLFLTPIAPL